MSPSQHRKMPSRYGIRDIIRDIFYAAAIPSSPAIYIAPDGTMIITRSKIRP
eukprot:COSAG06_NODE_38646_length_421_cov_0.847826_2_plen_51_part_01